MYTWKLNIVQSRKRPSALIGAALLAIAATSHQAGAGVILQDQGNFTAQIDFSEPYGQSFVAEDALVSFAFWYDVINPGSQNDPLEFRLYDGAGTDGPLLFTNGFDLAEDFSAFYDIDLSSVPLIIGQTYTAAATIPGDSARWGIRYSQDDLYAGGELHAAVAFPQCGTGATGCDTRFRVTPRSVSVPEPGSLALLGLGLVAVGIARRQRSI